MHDLSNPVALHEIEEKARQMRAEAIRDLLGALKANISGLFAPKGHRADA